MTDAANDSGSGGGTPPSIPPHLLERFARVAGLECNLNMGAASCVNSVGCNGVSQEDLARFADVVAAHIVVGLKVVVDAADRRLVAAGLGTLEDAANDLRARPPEQ